MYTSPSVSGPVRTWLRAEAIAYLAIGIVLYRHLGGSWPMFFALFLVPDVSLLGFLFGPRLGAWAYNSVHSSVGPIALGLVGIALAPAVLPYACIWIAHVGFDRTLGYGLKYTSGFGDTHLGHIGKHAPAPAAALMAS